MNTAARSIFRMGREGVSERTRTRTTLLTGCKCSGKMITLTSSIDPISARLGFRTQVLVHTYHPSVPNQIKSTSDLPFQETLLPELLSQVPALLA